MSTLRKILYVLGTILTVVIAFALGKSHAQEAAAKRRIADLDRRINEAEGARQAILAGDPERAKKVAEANRQIDLLKGQLADAQVHVDQKIPPDRRSDEFAAWWESRGAGYRTPR